jgi:hypothetical protein
MSNPTDTAIDAARESFLAQFAEDEATPSEAPAAEVVAQATPEPVEGEAPAAEQSAAPEAPAKESEARAYRKLLAREAKLREEAKALEADRAALAEFKRAQAKLKADPLGYLRAAGLTQAEMLEALEEARLADLGDLAPPEARVKLAAKRAERLNADTQEKLQAQAEAAERAIQEREAKQFIQQYQAGIEQFAATSISEYPYLEAQATAGRPVVQALYQTAVEMAQANPDGPAPSYAEVAAQLDRQLAELAAVKPKSSTPTAVPTTAAPTVEAPKPILRNSTTQAQPSPAPMPEGLSYNELRERIRQDVLTKYGF